jgi:hypothetical protein
MNITCPTCHATHSLEAITQDEAARELIVLIGELPPAVRPHMYPYLGLFRSKTRALAWSRAVKLAREVLEIGAEPVALGVALAETVESMRAKRDAGDVRPLTKHNYLKRVLESTLATPESRLQVSTGEAPSRRGRKATGLVAQEVLRIWAGDDWLRIEISNGLLALLALPLYKSPDPDTVDRTASLWERELRKGKIVLVEEIDRMRIQKGFAELLSVVKEKFPEPSLIRDHLPRRPEQKKMETEIPEEEVEVGREILRSFTEEQS